ncbi:MAG TPA: rhodanese-like domain-containing protein, partial [Thermoanaerobaculia bacterium]|nr:rhodanese-like domain-containing protein [Thermoanaerobaculia bacterium]
DLRGEAAWESFADQDGAPGVPGVPGIRAGHIPHSLPFDPAGLLPADGWPDPAQARQALGRIGPRDDDFIDLDAEIVLYGDGPEDPRLGLAYLLLRGMDVRVRVFAGGWREWSSHPATPVVRIVGTEGLRQLLAPAASGSAGRPLPSPVLLDLRGEDDFQLSHLPGARSLPIHLLSSLTEVVDRHWPGTDRARTPVVFYCYGRSCIRSRNACSAAAHAGFQNLLWYREGIPAWQQAGLPLSRPAP